MFLYLDESGDLGFDFKNKKPSKFFVITLLKLDDEKSIKLISKAISKTLETKINHKRKKGRIIEEVKGNDTTIKTKKYFLNCLYKEKINFLLYSIVLDKTLLLKNFKNPRKDIIYNQMSHQILEKIDFSLTKIVNLAVDRSKNDWGIKEFNNYLVSNLRLCLNLEAKLYITHEKSQKNKLIQAVDMFCYGIFRKYELQDENWYNLFKENIVIECKFER